MDWSTETNLTDRLLSNACDELEFNTQEVVDKIWSNGIEGAINSYNFKLIEKPTEHSILCGAIRMWELYRNSPLEIDGYVNIYKKWLRPDVVEFMTKHKEVLNNEIKKNYFHDFQLSNFAVSTLINGYLSRVSRNNDPQEILQMAYMRISCGAFCNRECSDEERLNFVLDMYSSFSRREGTAASPTFFNLGRVTGAPSSCMIFSIDDKMEDILKIIFEVGMASKNNAGIGIDISHLRHSMIGNQGMSQGIVPLARIFDLLGMYVNQGGQRPGAICVTLRAFHIDLPEFIQCVDQTQEEKSRVEKLNTSIVLCDLFMERFKSGEKWSLFCPKQSYPLVDLHGDEFNKLYVEMERKAEIWSQYNEYTLLSKLNDSIGSHLSEKETTRLDELKISFDGKSTPSQVDTRKICPIETMKTICAMQSRKGMPYIVHGCTINSRNNMKNVGPVHGPNLCQEIVQPTIPGKLSSGCNLASLSLKSFVSTQGDTPYFDFKKFGEAVRRYVRFVNQVIDNTINVSDKVKKSNNENRTMGLGVSGFADMCYLLKIPCVDTERVPDVSGEIISINSLDKTIGYDEKSLNLRIVNPVLSDLNWKIWSCMYYNALLCSSNEAKLFERYSNFNGSPFSEGKLQFDLVKDEMKRTARNYKYNLDPCEPSVWGQEGSWEQLKRDVVESGTRNAMLLTIMPTASSAQIIDNCESVEYPMQNLYKREVLSGEFAIVNSHMVRDLSEIGMWNKSSYENLVSNDGSILYLSEEGLSNEQIIRLRKIKETYLTMWEIPKKLWIDLCLQRQPFIEQSMSMNIYNQNPDPEKLMKMHYYTWINGAKTGIYYLRSRSPGEASKLGLKQKVATSRQYKQITDQMNMKVGGNSKSMITEYTDTHLEDLAADVQTMKDEEIAKMQKIREEEIEKELGSSSTPMMCTMEEGCVSCQ